ncbi:MAG: SUMF1/EgtB/PvdO family nonheme iron enzyme [Bacteroidaceae bacterium]|nr:SUMF1/EgtB/PvdO family nonheme iron enzyme [Bacteroidaceae bacterium]
MKKILICIILILSPLMVTNAQKVTEITIKNDVVIKMVSVQGGTYTMGDSDCTDYADYAREVTVDNFAIGQTEVTQGLWETVMYGKPAYAKKKHSYLYAMGYTPMDCVSWDDCQKFIKKLNKLTGKKFRLPTEAEWEFAARGGKLGKGYTYSGSDILDSVAWHSGNSGRIPHRVCTKQPNELGIYDMTGNVREWCQDGMDYYGRNRSLNSGDFKVYRGGCYDYDDNNYIVRLKNHHGQANFHDQGLPGLGFRLALSE